MSRKTLGKSRGMSKKALDRAPPPLCSFYHLHDPKLRREDELRSSWGIDQTLGHCHALLDNGFAEYEATHQACAEKVEAVHWYIHDQVSQGVIPASHTQKVWLKIENTFF